MMPARPVQRVEIVKVRGGESGTREDALAVEEPMEIRIVSGGAEKSVSITMRTPGNDFELAAGFLFGEGIVRSRGEIRQISYCARAAKKDETYNVVRVELDPSAEFDFEKLSRNFYVNSSCGVCGKTSLEALEVRGRARIPANRPLVSRKTISSLPAALRREQAVFEKTGGLHAAALFTPDGKLETLMEDVGRHNGVDKLVGEQLLAGRVPLHDSILLVSGRAGFEIAQKAAAAGIPLVAAVGAPSSLAVDLAQSSGMTLIGFLRDDSFNIYSAPERVT